MRLVGFLAPAAVRPLFTLHISAPFHRAPYEFVFSAAQPLAAGVIVLLSAINYLSIRSGGHIQLVATSLKIASIVAIVGLGVASPRADFSNVLPASTHLTAGIAGAFLAALVPVMWAFNGWHLLGAVGEEVENPARNFPRALAYGMLVVLVVYVLVNWVFLRVLAFSSVAASSAVASDAFQKMLGGQGAKWLTIAMMISVLGTLHINLLASARIPFAMARDGLFFVFASRVQPVFRSPSGGLLFMGGLSALLALSGTFEELVSLTVFALWIFFSRSVVALIRLRRIDAGSPRPYSTWGYPWVPILFLVSAVAMTVNLWLDQPVRSSIGLGIIVLGLPSYFYWRKKADAMTAPELS